MSVGELQQAQARRFSFLELLPWLIVFGLMFLAAGAVGRRRFNGERNEG